MYLLPASWKTFPVSRDRRVELKVCQLTNRSQPSDKKRTETETETAVR